MIDANTLEQQLGKLANDIGELTEKDHAIFKRMTAEEKAVVKDVGSFLRDITNNGERTLKEAIETLRNDHDMFVQYMQKLFAFAQIIKNHQRQGGSQVSRQGRVEAGKRRIGKPGA